MLSQFYAFRAYSTQQAIGDQPKNHKVNLVIDFVSGRLKTPGKENSKLYTVRLLLSREILNPIRIFKHRSQRSRKVPPAELKVRMTFFFLFFIPTY